MWFLPLLVVGAIAMALAKRSQRVAPPSRQLSAPPPTPSLAVPPGVPGPISVLGEILRVGQAPPPTVILCAIAEAQSIGRNDLAADIVKVFVAPVVFHAQRARARGTAPVYGLGDRCDQQVQYERGSCQPKRSPRSAADVARQSPPTSAVEQPTVIPYSERPPSSAAAAPVDAALSPTSMDDEINALLHTDPARFMQMVERGEFRAPRGAAQEPAPVSPPAAATHAAPVAPSINAVSPLPPGFPSDIVSQLQSAAVAPQAPERSAAPSPGSPIPGVPDPSWSDFVRRLQREAPEFASSRHVGQYRQRRERLAELGIDPNAIAGSPQAQRAALDADLADAHRHGAAGEVFSQHLGRPIAVPGREGAETITLSGVLGVIQCAGLEGAVGWLERPNDRKRYPHTTQAFLRTNNVF